MQVASAPYEKPERLVHRSYKPQVDPDPEAIAKTVDLIMQSRRPILYTGGGIINAGPEASAVLRVLADMMGAPVTSTLMGLGAFPASSPQWLGMLGMHGTYEANLAMNRADLILCLGAPLRRPRHWPARRVRAQQQESPCRHRPLVDHKVVSVDVPVVADCGRAIEAIIAELKARGFKAAGPYDWWVQIGRLARQAQPRLCRDRARDHAPARHRRAVQGDARQECHHHHRSRPAPDVGAQHFHFDEPNRWLTSGGLGTMGYGFPAAIGAQLGNPDALVIDIAGDASIQMNIQEMGTATQYMLPVKIFILNNEYMGMVRQWQELTYESRYSHSYSDSLPDFVKLAEAYGWKGIRIEGLQELEAGIQEMIATPGPVLVDCRVARLSNCFPMIPSGAAPYRHAARPQHGLGHDG